MRALLRTDRREVPFSQPAATILGGLTGLPGVGRQPSLVQQPPRQADAPSVAAGGVARSLGLFVVISTQSLPSKTALRSNRVVGPSADGMRYVGTFPNPLDPDRVIAPWFGVRLVRDDLPPAGASDSFYLPPVRATRLRLLSRDHPPITSALNIETFGVNAMSAPCGILSHQWRNRGPWVIESPLLVSVRVSSLVSSGALAIVALSRAAHPMPKGPTVNTYDIPTPPVRRGTEMGFEAAGLYLIILGALSAVEQVGERPAEGVDHEPHSRGPLRNRQQQDQPHRQ